MLRRNHTGSLKATSWCSFTLGKVLLALIESIALSSERLWVIVRRLVGLCPLGEIWPSGNLPIAKLCICPLLGKPKEAYCKANHPLISVEYEPTSPKPLLQPIHFTSQPKWWHHMHHYEIDRFILMNTNPIQYPWMSDMS